MSVRDPSHQGKQHKAWYSHVGQKRLMQQQVSHRVIWRNCNCWSWNTGSFCIVLQHQISTDSMDICWQFRTQEVFRIALQDNVDGSGMVVDSSTSIAHLPVLSTLRYCTMYVYCQLWFMSVAHAWIRSTDPRKQQYRNAMLYKSWRCRWRQAFSWLLETCNAVFVSWQIGCFYIKMCWVTWFESEAAFAAPK